MAAINAAKGKGKQVEKKNRSNMTEKDWEEKFLQLMADQYDREPTGLQGVFKSVFPIQDFSHRASLQFVSYEGSFSATEGAAMRNGMIVSASIYFALSGWAADSWGNHGVWGGIWAFLALRGLTLLVQYPRLERRAGPAP